MVSYRQLPTQFSAANERLHIRLRELAEQRRRTGYIIRHFLLCAASGTAELHR